MHVFLSILGMWLYVRASSLKGFPLQSVGWYMDCVNSAVLTSMADVASRGMLPSCCYHRSVAVRAGSGRQHLSFVFVWAIPACSLGAPRQPGGVVAPPQGSIFFATYLTRIALVQSVVVAWLPPPCANGQTRSASSHTLVLVPSGLPQAFAAAIMTVDKRRIKQQKRFVTSARCRVRK